MNFFKKMFSVFMCFLTLITSFSSVGAMKGSGCSPLSTCASDKESHSRVKMTIAIVSYDDKVANDIIKKCPIKTRSTDRRSITTTISPSNRKRYDVEFISLPYEYDKWRDETYVSDFVLKNKKILSESQYVLFVYNMGVQKESFDIEKGGIDSLIQDLSCTPIVYSGVAFWFKSIKSINRNCAYLMVGDYSHLESAVCPLKDEEVKKLQDFNSELSIQLERQLIWGQLIPNKRFPQCRSFAVVPGEKDLIDDRIAEYLPELEQRHNSKFLRLIFVGCLVIGVVLIGTAVYYFGFRGVNSESKFVAS